MPLLSYSEKNDISVFGNEEGEHRQDIFRKKIFFLRC